MNPHSILALTLRTKWLWVRVQLQSLELIAFVLETTALIHMHLDFMSVTIIFYGATLQIS